MRVAISRCLWAVGMAVLAAPALLAAEKEKPMQAPEVAEHRGFTVAGVEFADAGEKPYLILYSWVALATKLGAVRNPVKPRVLYGVWYRLPERKAPSYLVGVEVADASALPEGLAARRIEGGRYIRMAHRGNVGRIGEAYDAIMRWMKEKGAEHREGATFEVYDTTQGLSDDYMVPIYEPIR